MEKKSGIIKDDHGCKRRLEFDPNQFVITIVLSQKNVLKSSLATIKEYKRLNSFRGPVNLKL
jgi:hypothetical protein